jgi:hypothetical protein
VASGSCCSTSTVLWLLAAAVALAQRCLLVAAAVELAQCCVLVAAAVALAQYCVLVAAAVALAQCCVLVAAAIALAQCGGRNGLVTFYVETAFYDGLLKERYKGG